ncbi:MAG: class IIb bacteriocin, lactobin A/cerein 7B family [Ekhidna sp.]
MNNNTKLVELTKEECENTDGGIIMFLVGHGLVAGYAWAMFESGRSVAKNFA